MLHERPFLVTALVAGAAFLGVFFGGLSAMSLAVSGEFGAPPPGRAVPAQAPRYAAALAEPAPPQRVYLTRFTAEDDAAFEPAGWIDATYHPEALAGGLDEPDTFVAARREESLAIEIARVFAAPEPIADAEAPAAVVEDIKLEAEIDDVIRLQPLTELAAAPRRYDYAQAEDAKKPRLGFQRAY